MTVRTAGLRSYNSKRNIALTVGSLLTQITYFSRCIIRFMGSLMIKDRIEGEGAERKIVRKRKPGG